MKKLITFLYSVLLLNTSLVQCQKYDYNILVGFRSNDTVFNDYRGITRFNFNTNSLNPEILYDSFKLIDFHWTVNNLSDFHGNYLFSYNGYIIENFRNRIIQNGIGGFTRQNEFGDVVYQSGLLLPLDKNGPYVLFHESEYLYPEFGGAYFSNGLNYSIIDINKNSGDGEVIYKNIALIKDTLDYGRILAIKHANGRDWWILKGRHDMQASYTFLATKDTIQKYGIQNIGDKQYNPFGCVSVSPKGDKIVYVSQHEGVLYGQGGTLGLFLHFLDFDRCTGQLSNPKSLQVDSQRSFLFGGAFSPDGKLFYLSRKEYVFQIDMSAPDIILDTVAIYDNFKYVSPGNAEYHTWFGFIQNMPDGRIYGTTSSSFQQYMFYINKPNIKGKECDLRQHAIKVTAHYAIPNFPNYRLGPIDNSFCDTIGIDNTPIAEFRYDQDTFNYLKFEFTDLSAYEVEEWYWDFEDPNSSVGTSRDTNPIHTFSQNGVYEVCLIVKNKNGADTLCRTITIGTVSTKGNDKKIIDIQAWPNPCKDFLIINVLDYNPQKMVLQVYNSIGELALSKRLYQGSNSVDVENLNSGIYFISILERGTEIKSEKLIKL